MIYYIKKKVSYFIDMITKNALKNSSLYITLILVLVEDMDGLKTSLGIQISNFIIIIIIILVQIVMLSPLVRENKVCVNYNISVKQGVKSIQF